MGCVAVELPEEHVEIDWNHAVIQVNAAMAERGWSSNDLARRAGLDRKTIDNLRNGKRVKPITLRYVEQALDLELTTAQQTPRSSMTAKPELGAYSKLSYGHYAGLYYMFRNSYENDDRIVCSLLKITWDDGESCLRFEENQRNQRADGKFAEYLFAGEIAIPPSVGITQFVSRSSLGFTRVMTTTSLRDSDRRFFKGVLLGICEVADVGYRPAVSPVYLEGFVPSPDWDPAERIGSIKRGALWHPEAAEMLDSARSSFAAFWPE